MAPQLLAAAAVRFFCCSQLLLQFVLLRQFVNAFSVSQRDCQVNELFIECGTCEGSCREPIITNCRKECKPPRCECRAKLGYVRAHDGACVPISECATYKGSYVAKDGTRPLSDHDGTNKVPTTAMHNEGKEVGFPPSIRPPSIRPPSTGRHRPTKQQPLQDQVIQVGPSPPVIVSPNEQSHPVGTSRMNLFADLANAHFNNDDATSDKTETTKAPKAQTVVHSVRHQSQSLESLLRQSPAAQEADKGSRIGRTTSLTHSFGEEKASENAKLAKCGERRCSTTASREIDETNSAKQQLTSADKQKRNKNNAFSFALMNHGPSSAVSNSKVHFLGAVGGIQPRKHFGTREQRQIPPLAPNLRIYRKRRQNVQMRR